jgi:colanic acid biosynthesis glycosyl transferase WcaI
VTSEVAMVFNKSHGGYFFDSNAFDDVVNTISTFSSNSDNNENMGLNAREYVIEKFSSKSVLKNFESKISQVISS